MQQTKVAPPAAPDAARGLGARAVIALVGLACCCVVGGALAAVPRAGIAISLGLAVLAAAHVAGKLHFLALGRSAAWLLGATSAFGTVASYAALRVERKKDAEQVAEAAREAEAEVERMVKADELRLASRDVMVEGRAALTQARGLIASAQYEDVEPALYPALSKLHELAALEPEVDGARVLRDESVALADEARGFVSTKRAFHDGLEHANKPGTDLIAYDRLLEGDLSALRAAPDAARTKYRMELVRAVNAVEARRRTIAKKVEAAKDAERHRVALAAVCGEGPDVDSLDFLVNAELVLSQAAHSPDSIDVSTCSAPVMDGELCWVSTCEVRGTNALGVNVMNRMRIVSDRRGVVQVLR